MSYRVQSINNIYQVFLENEPAYCHALNMAPPKRETLLNHGRWLILVFAVWSSPDQLAIGSALQVVKKFEGQVNLGIRPFDDYEELETWCPEAKGGYGSPLWLLLNEGTLINQWVGIQKLEGLELEITKTLSAKNTK